MERGASGHRGRHGIVGRVRVPTRSLGLSGAAFKLAEHLIGGRRQPVKAEPRCRERRGLGLVGRLQMLLKLSELGRDGFPYGILKDLEVCR